MQGTTRDNSLAYFKFSDGIAKAMTEYDYAKNDTTSWQEIAYSNMIQLEALTRLLVAKSLITKEEFLGEVQNIQEILRQREKQISGDDS